jgi:phosphatidate cytidylyltransferase
LLPLPYGERERVRGKIKHKKSSCLYINSQAYQMKSNLLTRVIIAFIFGPIIICVTLLGKLPFLALVEVCIILGLWEFSYLARLKGSQIPKWILLPLGVFLGISVYLWGEKTLIFFLLGMLYLTAFVLIIKGQTEGATFDLSVTILSLFYVAGLFSFLILIREMPLQLGLAYKIGGLWIVFLLLSIWSCDTFAYFIGAPLGKHKLSPAVSPNKTVEGFFGGILGALVVAFFSYHVFFKSVGLKHLLIISIFVSLIGQIGDLTESLFKRDAKLKDISHLIPGHGGILDRFDSLLFVSPIVYYYLKFVVYG